MGKEIIEFQPPPNDGTPKIVRARGGSEATRYCAHIAQLHIDERTQLITCTACRLQMSAYSALLLITKQWERMHYDTAEWKRMKEEQAKQSKAIAIKRHLRHLHWIELPAEGDEPARTYWTNVTQALGHEPYALFNRGRGKTGQYCVLTSPPMGESWQDADSLIVRRMRGVLEPLKRVR